MADGAVNFLLEKLTTLLMQEASLLGDSQSDVEEIKLELEIMRSCIRDAERKKLKSDVVETWVRQVREVAQKVEDMLDEYVYYKDFEEDRKGLTNKVQDLIKVPLHMNRRRKISLKIQKLKRQVHKSDEGRNGNTNASIDWWQRQEELLMAVDEDEIVGMEENKDKLMEWLMEDDPRRMVISVVGMGGLGKTTLATKVYNDEAIQRYFDCWAWVSVSQTNGVVELLRSMIKKLFGGKRETVPSDLGKMNYRELVEMLICYLREKRYVIILDDVWNILLWSRIRSAFPENGLGSRVIFTTRNDNVAKSVGPGNHILHLDPLGEDDSWALFCRKAFWTDLQHSCPVELKDLAQAITKKCEGLPLAIVAIGGLVCSRDKTAIEWKKIYDSLNWELNNNPVLESVKGILSLSFNDLSFYLKHCFLYCCVFRDGYPIKRKKLIRLWVAEGFILERKGITAEEVAEEYLTELCLRSMIQVTETNDSGRVKTFRVHDVMRELATTTSQKENFCLAYDDTDARLVNKVQRLSVYNRGGNIRLSSSMSRHLRAFFVFQIETNSSFPMNAFLSGFKLLKVLELEGVPIRSIPVAVTSLFNLRYLNLRETNISELPKSMERLRNLQTLDIRNTNLKKLPNGISNMPRLRHLLLCDLRKIGNLTELKRLDITKVKAVHGPKLCSSVEKMTGLRRLSITASTKSEELLLENLSFPPAFLQKLALVGKLNSLPRWLESLANLTHIYLCCSGLGDNMLLSLQNLPTLVFLELKNASKCRFLHFTAGGFPKLNKMRLLELVELRGLRLDKRTLPNIKDLNLTRCPEMRSSLQGIEHLTTLQKLHLEEMPEELVQRLRNEESVNVRHINTISLVYLSGQSRVSKPYTEFFSVNNLASMVAEEAVPKEWRPDDMDTDALGYDLPTEDDQPPPDDVIYVTQTQDIPSIITTSSPVSGWMMLSALLLTLADTSTLLEPPTFILISQLSAPILGCKDNLCIKEASTQYVTSE
ncbi:disease resistance protein RPM1 [Artemisia annua]|uniref:Disease resistance protein RPM1 n=1 Tax=Artemisia annua TaxID=35608 RepID=A0A2U1P2I9_ARTAN|nr:disease resistance protein RPM1 [Artemisia annua]